MSIVVNTVFFCSIIINVFKNYRQAIIAYLIGCLICPVIKIGGIEIGFDIIAFPIICIFFFLREKNIYLKKGIVSFVPYSIVYVLLILLNALRFDSTISIPSLYALFRFVFMVYAIGKVFGKELIANVEKVLSVVLFVNTILSIIQMANLLPVSFFYDLYYKSSLIPLETQMQMGYFNRAYGATGSPVLLGGISALTYVFYLSTYVSPGISVKKNILKLAGAAICGVLALSKTAILAIPIMTVLILLLIVIFYGKEIAKPFLKVFSIVCLGLIVCIPLFSWMREKDFAIDWYLKYIFDPMSALSTRYDSTDGFLVQTIEIIKKHPLIGVGNASFDGAFVGDSSYVVILYETGIVGLIVYFIPYLVGLCYSIKTRNVISCSLIVTFLLIAIGGSLHFSNLIVLFVPLMLWRRDNENNKLTD